MTAENPDPWTQVVTAGGLAADEVISTLQKSIRRNLVENAVLCAHEMWASGEELEQYLWDRLQVIAVEDVGSGRPHAIVEVVAAATARLRHELASHDRFLFAVHAVRLLAEAPKDRSTDELATWIRRRVARGAVPEVFDAALDMHTRRGREMGRGFAHFFMEGARTRPESDDRNLRWRRLLLDDEGIEPEEE